MRYYKLLGWIFILVVFITILLAFIPPIEVFHGVMGKWSMENRSCGGWFSQMHSDDINDAEPLFYIEGKCLAKNNIPRNAELLLVAAEDTRFFWHIGIDPFAIGRAALVDLKCRCFKQGGSTITQQLVRNVFLTPDKNLFRKGLEALIALKIESFYSKEEILAHYLNYVYYGDEFYDNTVFKKPIFGIEQASEHYFGKEAKDLTMGESALIIATLRNPKYYSPYIHFERVKARQELILNRALDYGLITWIEYNNAMNEELHLIGHNSSNQAIFDKYYGNGSGKIISEIFLKNN